MKTEDLFIFDIYTILMKALFVCLTIAAFLSCNKTIIKTDRSIEPESKNELQIHQWNLDSVITMQNGNVINYETIKMPDYKYYQFYGQTYSYWSSASGIKSTHTGNYEYASPEKIFFWDLNKLKQANAFSTIEILTGNTLVFYDLNQSGLEGVKKTLYYFHAQ